MLCFVHYSFKKLLRSMEMACVLIKMLTSINFKLWPGLVVSVVLTSSEATCVARPRVHACVDSLGPVMVEQASANWGQKVEPCLLQSSSLDATQVWHLRARPLQTEQERAPGLKLSMDIHRCAGTPSVLSTPFSSIHTQESPPTGFWDL